jgi:hypothetical protein
MAQICSDAATVQARADLKLSFDLRVPYLRQLAGVKYLVFAAGALAGQHSIRRPQPDQNRRPQPLLEAEPGLFHYRSKGRFGPWIDITLDSACIGEDE